MEFCVLLKCYSLQIKEKKSSIRQAKNLVIKRTEEDKLWHKLSYKNIFIYIYFYIYIYIYVYIYMEIR